MLMYMMMIDTPEDQSKFEIMYRQYGVLLFYAANKILNHKQDAEEGIHHTADINGNPADIYLDKDLNEPCDCLDRLQNRNAPVYQRMALERGTEPDERKRDNRIMPISTTDCPIWTVCFFIQEC